LILRSEGDAASIGGNALQFAGLDARLLQEGSGDFTIALDLEIDVPTLFRGDGSGVVTLNGALRGGGAIVKSGNSTFELSSVFQGSPSQNTFHGGIFIEKGTLRFANAVTTGRTALRATPVALESNEATLLSASELRVGELSGAAGTVLARDEAISLNGQNILLYPYGSAEFGGVLNNLASIPSGIAGNFSVRGAATQTLSGTVLLDGVVTIGHGAGLRLSGTAALVEGLKTTFSLNGGSLTLDNLAQNNPNRIRDSRNENAGIESIGGGTVSLVGNAAGTREAAGLLELGSRAAIRSGAMTVNVTHPSGASAATVLEFFELSRYSINGPRSTVNFTAQDENGRPLTLGRPGKNPRIQFSTRPVVVNGLLAPNDTGELDQSVIPPVPNGYDDHIGWATVNGSNFATYGANGIAAVKPVPFPFGDDADLNAVLTGDEYLADDIRFSLNSLKIAPASRGRRLTIAGKGDLRTNAILLAGETDFSIVNPGNSANFGGLIGQGGSRYFYVQSAVLTLGVHLGARLGVPIEEIDPVTKSGAGTLALENEQNYLLLKSLTINEGTVRAVPGTSLPGGRIDFRGGVLEISGGGSHAFSLGTDPGTVNWRGDETLPGGIINNGESPTDKGSGGFSAFGADATVTLRPEIGTELFWEDKFFIDSNHALIFGSTRADHGITLTNGITLLDTALAQTINFNAREFRVIDNPNSTRDFARLSGVISGPVYTDLLKTGDGFLELTGNNSAFLGGIVVAEGSLLTNDSHGFGSDAGAYILLGMRSGKASSALLTSHSSGSLDIEREISVQSGSLGAAVIGNAALSGSAGDARFTGKIMLGLAGCGIDRTLRLHAEPGTSVTFSGGIVPVEGYLGSMGIELSGEGRIFLAGANHYRGTTLVTHGTLQLLSANALPPGSRLSIGSGARVAVDGFHQRTGLLEGMGNIDLGAAILTTGEDDASTLFGGVITGQGGIVKTGTGRLMLVGASSYQGDTVVENGILAVENTTGSATGSGRVLLRNGGVLEGGGAVSGSVTVQSGGILSPGDGIGSLASGTAVYEGGGRFEWELQEAAGKGAETDVHQIQGGLVVTATPANPFTVDIRGLGRGGDPGQVARFSSSSDYSWVIASASGGITGFDPAAFRFDTTQFVSHNPTGTGSFSIVQRGNDLVVLFTGAPLGGAGSYEGLVTNDAPTHFNSGYIRLNTTRNGAFSGVLKFAGYTYSLRGKFDQSGNYSSPGVKSKNGFTLPITLHLDRAGNQIIGEIGGTDSTLVARRQPRQTAGNSVREAGAYTLLLPPDPTKGAGFPQGYGYATLRVSGTGTIRAAGRLGDGTPFSLGALLGGDGTFPVYLALYFQAPQTAGSLRGVIGFEEKPGLSDFDGLLAWDKPPRPQDTYYPLGFSGSVHLIGSRYLAPKAGNRALDVPGGNAQFSLPESEPVNILIAPNNTVTVVDTPNSHSLKLILGTRTGLFSGSFQNELQKRTRFEGVLFQKQRLGAGLFFGSNQCFPVSFGPP
ncbi:MAG: autotransporter-associated beta strand repeat-containing protein, partial [Verrucomicrobiota bacterium]